MKQSNQNSPLLEQLIKAAEGAKPKEYRSEFVQQILPIVTAKQKTFQEVLADIMNKKAQVDPMVGSDPAPAAPPPAGDTGLEPPLGDDLGETEPTEEDPASLVRQALELLEKAQAALGGTPESTPESATDDISVDDAAPVTDMVDSAGTGAGAGAAAPPAPML